MYVRCWSQCTLGKCSEAQLQAELPAPSFSFEVETKTNKEKHVQTTSWCPASSLTLFTEETSDLVLHVCLSLLQLLLHRPGTRYNTRGLWNATEPSRNLPDAGLEKQWHVRPWSKSLPWSTYRWPSSMSLRSRRCLSWVRENHSISICSSSSSKIRHKRQCDSELIHTAITESGLFHVQPQFKKALEQNAMNCKPFLIKM